MGIASLIKGSVLTAGGRKKKTNFFPIPLALTGKKANSSIAGYRELNSIPSEGIQENSLSFVEGSDNISCILMDKEN